MRRYWYIKNYFSRSSDSHIMQLVNTTPKIILPNRMKILSTSLSSVFVQVPPLLSIVWLPSHVFLSPYPSVPWHTVEHHPILPLTWIRSNFQFKVDKNRINLTLSFFTLILLSCAIFPVPLIRIPTQPLRITKNETRITSVN